MSSKNKNTGSSFDDFLAEEGLLESATDVATKRVLAWELRQLMDVQGLTKTALAKRMDTSRSALDRLLDPDNESVTLQTLQKAARVMGKRVEVRLVAA